MSLTFSLFFKQITAFCRLLLGFLFLLIVSSRFPICFLILWIPKKSGPRFAISVSFLIFYIFPVAPLFEWHLLPSSDTSGKPPCEALGFAQGPLISLVERQWPTSCDIFWVSLCFRSLDIYQSFFQVRKGSRNKKSFISSYAFLSQLLLYFIFAPSCAFLTCTYFPSKAKAYLCL